MFKKCKVLLFIGLLAMVLMALSATASMAQGSFSLGGWWIYRGFSLDCEALLKGIGKQLEGDPNAVFICAVAPTKVTAYAKNPGDQWGDREGIPFKTISELVAGESASDLWIVVGRGKASAQAIIPDSLLFESVFGVPPYESNPNYQEFISFLPNPGWSLVTPEDDPGEVIVVLETPAYVATYYCSAWEGEACTGAWELKDYDSSDKCTLDEDGINYTCVKKAWDDIPTIPNFPTPP